MDGVTPTGGRPSGRAVRRLADALGGEVEQLRGSLRAALDEAAAHEAAGRPELAVEALESQRRTLLALHERLAGHVADAAVEREAERVVADAQAVAGRATEGPARRSGAASPVVPITTAGRDRASGRAVPGAAAPSRLLSGLRVAAATAAVVAAAAGLLGGPAGPGVQLSLAGTTAGADRPASGATTVTSQLPPASPAPRAAAAPDGTAAEQRASGDRTTGPSSTAGDDADRPRPSPEDGDAGTDDVAAALRELVRGVGEVVDAGVLREVDALDGLEVLELERLTEDDDEDDDVADRSAGGEASPDERGGASWGSGIELDGTDDGTDAGER